MIILGVDPGLRSMGYGVIETAQGESRPLKWGTIVTKPKTALPERLLSLYQGICTALDEMFPEVVAFESLIFARNVRSALLLGQARGVALLAAAEKGLRVVEYSPKEIKKTICGSGNAGKDQVKQMVQVLLGLRGEKVDTDAGDALAVALSHSLLHSRRELIDRQKPRNR